LHFPAHGSLIPPDFWPRRTGLINVFVLITSGLFAAIAVEAARAGRTRLVRWCLVAAALLGLVFLGFKAAEYLREFALGYGIESGTFFTLYYLITGFHALHVIGGILVLALVGVWPTLINVETGAAFWHMVDLVWLIVFPVVYLVR